MSEIPPSARVDPNTAIQLRTFWQEVGDDSMYDLGLSQQSGESCLTPIYLFVRRSFIRRSSYLSSMNLEVSLAVMEDIREGRFVSSPPPKHPPSDAPEGFEDALRAAREADGCPPLLPPGSVGKGGGQELRFRFVSLESLGFAPDAHGFFRKRLSISGRIPNPNELRFEGDLHLVIACRQLADLEPLVLRPNPQPCVG